jgi:Pyruvate phosphate dikinase, AMP/ATP-binding domain
MPFLRDLPTSLRGIARPLGLAAAILTSPALGGGLAGGCSNATVVDDGPPDAQLTNTLSLPYLQSARVFRAFGTEGGGFGQAGRLLKFVIDARSGGSTTYFVNGNYRNGASVPDYATYHFSFAQHQLGIGEDRDAFNNYTYYSNDKRFIAGSIQSYTLGKSNEPAYAIQFYPDDVIHEEGILRAAQLLKPQLRIPGARILFVATGPQQTFARVAPQLRALGVEPMTIDQVLGDIQYLPLNAGEAWGYLRIFPTSQGVLRPTDIPLFNELPLDLSVVSATITKAYQDVTSHVNLKSKERGTPNMVLRDASQTHPLLAPYNNKPIHLTVSKTGFSIEATTDAEVEKRFAERQNKPWKELPELTVTELVDFDNMCPTFGAACVESTARFGGKALGLGFLAHPAVIGRTTQVQSLSEQFGYDLTPYGFGVPVARYRDFLRQNPALQTKLQAFIAQEKLGNLSRDERQTLTRDIQLEFLAGRVPAADVADVDVKLTQLRTQFPAIREFKFRSSANAEDIANFDGAGLHDSFSVKVNAVDDADQFCLIDEQRSGDVVTKLRVIPQTPQCAIKAVYASLWNVRAVEERSFARLDHATSAMGLAVVPAYDTTENVVANGVIITRILNGADVLGYTVTSQEGNNLVTNPDPGTIAQLAVITFSATPTRPDRVTIARYATPTAGGPAKTTGVLSDDTTLQVVRVARQAERMYCSVKYSYNHGNCGNIEYRNDKLSSLDMEFKVLASGRIVVKQAREFRGR